MTIRIILIFTITTLIQGCFIAMPSRGPEGAGADVLIGETVELHRDILVVTYFTYPISWEPSQVSRIGENQRVVERLEKGTLLKVKSIKSFRMPGGMTYAFRCTVVDSGLTFDLSFGMLDSIGIDVEEHMGKMRANKAIKNSGA